MNGYLPNTELCLLTCRHRHMAASRVHLFVIILWSLPLHVTLLASVFQLGATLSAEQSTMVGQPSHGR